MSNTINNGICCRVISSKTSNYEYSVTSRSCVRPTMGGSIILWCALTLIYKYKSHTTLFPQIYSHICHLL